MHAVPVQGLLMMAPRNSAWLMSSQDSRGIVEKREEIVVRAAAIAGEGELMILGALVVAVGVAGALYAEARDLPTVRRIAKPIASAGFLLAAFGAPALRVPSGTGWLLLAALSAAALGDVLLLGPDRAWFLAGTGAFSLAHVGYAAWFYLQGLDLRVLAVATASMIVIGHLAWRWLDPHLTGPLRTPVRAYTAIVSLMVAFALANAARVLAGCGPAALLPAAGAVLFCASDVAVARQRFVKAEYANRAWGLPVYYLAQLLFASAVL